ncbi:MAG: phospho-sugar mutase, partial [Clostridia bacterium]|nr:phospho-sugar mutase [Clostridia bacterium]
MTDNIKREYDRWLKNADACRVQLEKMSGSEIEDAFYKNLEFGTGGLRGVLGAGTNRMNVYTVAAASQGLANYVVKNSPENKSVAVSYDSRINSDLFSKVAAEVFAANGIKVYIYPQLMPTPCLSFAVRKLKCAAGVMVTASHNPAKYNGYKVYGSDGCQITTVAAELILNEINGVNIFNDVKKIDFQSGICGGQIEFIPQNVYDEFIAKVKEQSVVNMPIDRTVAIIYSPLNGTGLKPVTRVLKESGFTNVTVVKEQEHPDGNFTTCPYPNPEIKEALALGLEYARKRDADIMLATDPDCDRVGIAVKDNNGNFRLLTGNETGLLLLDFICAMRTEQGTMPENPVMVKTVVTSGLGDKIAADYGVKTVNVLTGFKFIGEQIGLLEKQGKESDYIFGFEESYGYLTGGYVRDKDGV